LEKIKVLEEVDIKISCPLCNNLTTVIHDKVKTGKNTYIKNHKIYKCNTCGIVFQYPFVTNEYYNKKYSITFNYGDTPEEHFKASLKLATFRYIKCLPYIQGKTFLEVGCSSGAFLSLLKKNYNNKDITGIEPNIKYLNYIKKLGFTGYKDISLVKKTDYDNIFAFWVLEHTTNPQQFIIELLKHRAPNGNIFIEIPNVEEALLTIYDIPEFKDYQYQYPHNWYFSKDTISKLLNELNCAYTILPIQRYGLANHIGWMIDRKPLGNKNKYTNLFDPITLRSYRKHLETTNNVDNYLIIITKG
jgi:2-polyprenyl-3-methyl-5-hydroxy-6-metoxy-1,4-benzoquinol methylase